MPSERYVFISKAMHARQLILFNYGNPPRIAGPVILGYGADGEESVFTYQIGGRTSGNEKLPGWKCFKLDKLSDVIHKDGPWKSCGDSFVLDLDGHNIEAVCHAPG